MIAGLLVSGSLPARGSGRAEQLQDQITRNFDKSVTLAAGESVRIEHKLGNITVHTHDSRDVHIVATIRVSSGSRDNSSKFADAIQIHVDNSSSGLLIRTDYPEQNGTGWLFHENISFSVEYDIDDAAGRAAHREK